MQTRTSLLPGALLTLLLALPPCASALNVAQYKGLSKDAAMMYMLGYSEALYSLAGTAGGEHFLRVPADHNARSVCWPDKENLNGTALRHRVDAFLNSPGFELVKRKLAGLDPRRLPMGFIVLETLRRDFPCN